MISVIPIMTSNTTPLGIASASSVYDSTRPAWRGFNKNRNDAWLSQYSSGTVQTNQWLRYNLDTPKRVIKYAISALSGTTTEQWQVGTAPKSWRFEASNNGTDWVVLDEKINFSKELWVSSGGYQEFSMVNENFYLIYRLYLVSYQYSGATYFQINELDMYAASEHMLVKNDGNFFNYINNQFNRLSLVEPLSEGDYLSYGLTDISIIAESAWSQFTGEVELCYYTDDPNKTEASFNVETEPFTLAEEWEDKEIKIIEYTDNPNQTESTITIETEPFTLYDELGDSVDVLYYTDDPEKTSAELNITANYSPLDELEGDFDVVTWSDNNATKIATASSIPSPQSIIQTEDYYLYGDLIYIVDKLNSTNGTLRYAVSFNEGNSWEVCKFGKWRTIDISSLTTFRKSGMSHYDISLINSSALINKGDKIRFAYYIEDIIHNSDLGVAIDKMSLNINSATETIKMDNVAFYVLNTNATIQLTLSGSKLTGTLDDSDRGKVQYRILLNNKPYYPSDGTFTRLAPSPQNIDINISDREIIFNQPNTLKVEFQDFWGETDYWETTFIGSYSGLMFMDESGEYLSDTFGDILKQLDFEIIIAGQTTLVKKIKLKNQLGYAIDNVFLTMDERHSKEDVFVQLSRQNNPFEPTDYLTYGLMQPDDEIDFYIRIATNITAKPNPNGIFDLKVTADRV
nr:discoidin domain-containing protein [Paenibacillus xylanexedens]